MTVTVPLTRSRQEVEVALESADSFARVQLPDGRVVVIYGNGQLNVTLGTETRYHRLPVAADEVPSRRVAAGAAPRRPARPVRSAAVAPDPPAPAPAPAITEPVQAVARVGASGIRFVEDPGAIRRK